MDFLQHQRGLSLCSKNQDSDLALSSESLKQQKAPGTSCLSGWTDQKLQFIIDLYVTYANGKP